MANRSNFSAWLPAIAALSLVGCSIDGRKLEVTAGTAGTGSGTAGSGTTAGGGGGLGGGEKCSASSDCASGACLDQVCCGAPCAGVCVSCAAAVTGQTDGMCAKIQAGTNPHDECTKGSDVCGLDGQCDGAGACRFALPSTTCGTEACANDSYTPAAQCNGAGKCVTPSALSCGGHPCTGTRCDITCASSADCPMGLYCEGTTCAPQKTNGTMCGADGECSNAHCVEGVCCGSACTAKCNSCLQANTGQTDGTCALVRAGVAHGTDCPGSASCPASSSMSTPAPTCDGAGACKAGAGMSCGNYLCNAATMSCATSCTANGQCATNYCVAGTCRAKTATGQLCTSNLECQSGYCGGRCCTSAASPCVCPQPSSTNLIKNPGFDTSLAGWTVDSGSATINWQPGTFLDGNGAYADANACGFSGAAYLSVPDTNGSQLIWQCVSMTLNTDYDFGVQIATLGGASAFCDVDVYQGPGCTGTTMNVAEYEWINVDWSSGTFPSTFNSGFYVSAKVSCHVGPGGVAGNSFFFDDIYLTPAPGQY